MNTKKIMFGSFVGGCVTVLCFILLQGYWALAVVTGICAGFVTAYLFCDIKEVITKMPVAWASACNASGKLFSEQNKSLTLLNIIAFLLYAPLSVWIALVLDYSPSDRILFAKITVIFIMISMWILIVNVVCLILNSIGCRSPHKFAKRVCTYSQSPPFRFELVGRGSLICLDAFYGFIKKDLWAFIGKFFKTLYVQIHKRGRLIAGIDGVLGGLISCFCFAPSFSDPYAMGMAVVCGGFLGAAFGAVNHLFVSKKLLKVAVS